MRNGFSITLKFLAGHMMGICNKAAALGATFTGMSYGMCVVAFVLAFSLAANAWKKFVLVLIEWVIVVVDGGSRFVAISVTAFLTFRFNSLPNRSEIKSVLDVGSFFVGLLSFLSPPFDIDDGFHREPSILNDARTSLFRRNVGDADADDDDEAGGDGPDKQRYDADSGVSLLITFAVCREGA